MPLITSRMQWPYPAEDEDPWYSLFQSLVVAMDASAYASREDRHTIVTSDANVTFTASTGVLSWDAPIRLVNAITGHRLTIGTGNIVLGDGQMAYVALTRGLLVEENVVLTVVTSVPNTNDAQLFCIRSGTSVYFIRGNRVSDGQTINPWAGGGGGGGGGDVSFSSINVTPSASTQITIYVRPGGNDTTGDGITPSTAFRTVQKALNVIPLIKRGFRYFVDITGINDSAQAIVMPPFVNSDPRTNNFSDPVFYDLGYVTIHADQTVLTTLNPGTTTFLSDSISGLLTITDTSQAWTTDEWQGKFIHGNNLGSHAVVRGNNATQLFVTSALPSMTFPLSIVDCGATLTASGSFTPAMSVKGVRASVVFHGVHFAGTGFTFGAENYDYIEFMGCALGKTTLRVGGVVNFTGTYIRGVGTGSTFDSLFLPAGFNASYSMFHNLVPAFAGTQFQAFASSFLNCHVFDVAGGTVSVGLDAVEFIAQGLLMTCAGSIGNVRVDNAAPVAHINPNGSAIVVMGGASVNFGEGNFGGLGNAGYGVEINSGGNVWMEDGETCTFSITGTLGDLRVGDRPVRTWTDFNTNPPVQNEVDLSHQSRIGGNLQGDPIKADHLVYSATTPSDWPEGSPVQTASALDKLAARSGGGGGGGISGLTTNRVPYATSSTTIGDHVHLQFDPAAGFSVQSPSGNGVISTNDSVGTSLQYGSMGIVVDSGGVHLTGWDGKVFPGALAIVCDATTSSMQDPSGSSYVFLTNVFAQLVGGGITLQVDSTGASANCPIRPGAYVTGSRPSAVTSGAGAMIYDTTLSKPIWSDGAVWRDAMGTAV